MTSARFRALRRDMTGIAAVEFAAATPLLIFIFGGALDFGVAIWDHTVTVSAIEAGAAYAIANGQQNFTSTTIGPFLSTVANVVAGASLHGAPLLPANVTVLYNNQPNGTNLGMCYCWPAGKSFPGAASPCGSTCADGTTAGAFIQISATFPYTPLSPVDAPLLSGSYTDAAVVRVQ